MSDIDFMMEQFCNSMDKINPSEPSKDFILTGALSSISAATFASWTQSAHDYAIQINKTQEANKLLDLHEMAVRQANFHDVNTELTSFYMGAYNLKNAEISLNTITKLTENGINPDNVSFIKSNIEQFDLNVENVVSRAFGMVTSSLKTLKDKILKFQKRISNFGSRVKDIVSKVKEKIIDAFNEILKYFYQIFLEFISKIFSFIELIKKIGSSKGFMIKDVNIEFQPPDFSTTSIFDSFPMLIPKIVLPKITVNFDMEK